jgi:hypothetical protein
MISIQLIFFFRRSFLVIFIYFRTLQNFYFPTLLFLAFSNIKAYHPLYICRGDIVYDVCLKY